MSSFVETLRSIDYSKREPIKTPEIGRKTHPVVVVYVTLGKKLHAGHMLLMATADLVRKGMGDNEPLVLVNNNTGPRVAGALVALSQLHNVPIEEAARSASIGDISPEIIIDAYRYRHESGEDFERARSLLDQGRYDVFKPVVDVIGRNLIRAGFNVEVAPEASFLVQNQRVLQLVNPLWAGTGFNFFAEKGLSVLEKEGQVTATGKAVTSLVGVAKSRVVPGEEPFVVMVDASTDSLDAVHVFSSLGFGKAVLLPGAGISFNGEIASGTLGEAMTLGELIDEFDARCPNGKLISALQHLILTVPASRSSGKVMCLYDFKDNTSFVNTLASSFEDSLVFISRINELIARLAAKQGAESQVLSKGANDLLNFLPQRVQALISISNEGIVTKMSRFSKVGLTKVALVLAQQGYREDEAKIRAEEYETGQKELMIRENIFFSTLQSLLALEDHLVSLKPEQFQGIEKMIRFCMRRLGYETN